MNILLKNGIIFIFVVVIMLYTLKMANDVGEYWINTSWLLAFAFGFDTLYYLTMIDEYKMQKNKKRR